MACPANRAGVLCDGFLLRRLKVGIGFSPLVMFYRSGVDAVKVPRSTAPGARVVVFGSTSVGAR